MLDIQRVYIVLHYADAFSDDYRPMDIEAVNPTLCFTGSCS